MNAPPCQLDGADVLLYLIASKDAEELGWIGVSETDQRYRIYARAICRYPGENDRVYLFACDKDWEVIGDMDFDSVKEALKCVEHQYGIPVSRWTPTIPKEERND